MGHFSNHDLAILRQLANRQLEYANCAENDRILRQWKALEEGRRETPTVRLLFSNFTREVIDPRMRCEGKDARNIEYNLLSTLVGRELFGDDTPITPDYKVCWHTWCNPFGASAHLTFAENSMGYHIDPIVNDLEDDFHLLEGGSFGVDREGTLQELELAREAIGDLLDVHLSMHSLTAPITNPLVGLMGMETYYMSMYDYPELLHKTMDMATKIYEDYYDFLEREQLLLPTTGNSFVNQESFGYNHELPADHVSKTTECWGFLESQETHSVSPETFGEFVYPYQDRLVRRYGLLSYGCCERIDAIWPDYLSKWKNLRKLSISPFNKDDRLVGDFLRDTNVVFYSKPRAEYVTNPGPLDEPALEAYFKELCQAASGCLFEMAQREVGTIFGDYDRGRRYVQIARECIDRYWKP